MSWLIILGLVWIACDIIVVLFFIGVALQELRADRRPEPEAASGARTARAPCAGGPRPRMKRSPDPAMITAVTTSRIRS